MATLPIAQKPAVNARSGSRLPADKDQRAGLNYTPVVVNTGSKLVAIDTGLGLGMFEQSKGALGQYHSNLKAAGIDASQIDTVIISHFHGDHINGLVGAGQQAGVSQRRNHGSGGRVGVLGGRKPIPASCPRSRARQMGNVKRVFGALGNKVTQYDAGKELAPGITSLASPGHTPGHTSHVIASGNSKMLVQADITAGAASLFVRNPDWQFMFDTDKEHGGGDPQEALRHGGRGEDARAGLSLPVPGSGLCREERQRLSAGAGAVEPDDLVENNSQQEKAACDGGLLFCSDSAPQPANIPPSQRTGVIKGIARAREETS